jgi:hypothetical protein
MDKQRSFAREAKEQMDSMMGDFLRQNENKQIFNAFGRAISSEPDLKKRLSALKTLYQIVKDSATVDGKYFAGQPSVAQANKTRADELIGEILKGIGEQYLAGKQRRN